MSSVTEKTDGGRFAFYHDAGAATELHTSKHTTSTLLVQEVSSMYSRPSLATAELLRLTLVALAATSCQALTDAPGRGGARILWSHQDAAGAMARPYADQDVAVFTTVFARRVVALDAPSGRLRWQRDLTPGPAGLNMPLANVLSAGDLILVPAWDLYALDRSSGAVRWRVDGVNIDYPAGSSIALDGDRIISPGSVRRLYAFEAATGTVDWIVDLGERPYSPVVDRGTIYVGTSGPRVENSDALGAGHAVALSAANGTVLWKTVLPDATDSPWVGGTTQGGALTPELFIVASSNGR